VNLSVANEEVGWKNSSKEEVSKIFQEKYFDINKTKELFKINN
jgi:hypothetical protein